MLRLEFLGSPVTLVGGGVAKGACEVAIRAGAVAIVGDAVPCLARPIAEFKDVVSPLPCPIPLVCDPVTLLGEVISIGARRVPLVSGLIAGVIGIPHRAPPLLSTAASPQGAVKQQ